jgi:hypothetical protein
MRRRRGDARPPFRFDSCPGVVKRGLDGAVYYSTGTAWVRLQLYR